MDTFEKLTAAVASRVSEDGTDMFHAALIEMARVQRLVDDANKTMRERKSGMSGLLFTLAQNECNGEVQSFLTRCAKAEEAYKKAKEGRTIPTAWSQAKSNIKAALERDMDLTKFASESDMRKALTEARKAEKAEKEAKESVIEGANTEHATKADLYGALVAQALAEHKGSDLEAIAFDMAQEMIEKIRMLKDMPAPIEGEVIRTGTH